MKKWCKVLKPMSGKAVFSSIKHTGASNDTGFIKGGTPGKLTGCKDDSAR